MPAWLNSAESILNHSPRQIPLRWRRYRLGLLTGGLLWSLLVASLCGCGQTRGWVMNQSGRMYYKQGNYVAAKSEFERALMDNPYRASYAYNLAKSLEAQGDTSGAESMYQHALTLNPSHRPSYHGLSSMLNTQGRTDDARRLLAAWSNTQPYSATANLEAAQIEKSAGNYAVAEQQLNIAMDKRPAYLKARSEMKELQRDMGRPDLAKNLMYYRTLKDNAFYQNSQMHTNPMTGARLAPGEHMASYFPQADPKNYPGGIIQAAYSAPAPTGGMQYGAPMQMSPMHMPPQGAMEITPTPAPMGPGAPHQMSPQPMMQPQTLMAPQGAVQSAPMSGMIHGSAMPQPMGPQMAPMHGMPMQGQVIHGEVMQGAPMQPMHGQPTMMQPMQNHALPLQPAQQQHTVVPPMHPQMGTMQGMPVQQMPGQPMQGYPVQGQPMHGQPMMMQGQMMPPQQMNGMAPGMVPSPYPTPAPQGAAGPGSQPVELGAPVPVTQYPHSMEMPPMISGAPSVPAF